MMAPAAPTTRFGPVEPCERPAEIDVLVPAFNEAGTLAANLDELRRYLDGARRYSWRMIVVNDGSDDATGAIADAFARSEPRVVVVHHGRNKGLGAALRSGFALATGTALVVLDADLSYAPETIDRLVDAVIAGKSDVVAVSPYAKGGAASQVPTRRLLLSRAANKLLAASLGGALTTPTAMVRAYSREACDSLRFERRGMDVNLEIVADALRQGLRIAEIPAVLRWRGDDRERALRSRRLSLPALCRHTLAVIGWSMRLRRARVAPIGRRRAAENRSDRLGTTTA